VTNDVTTAPDQPPLYKCALLTDYTVPHQLDTISVAEGAVMVENVGATQLNVRLHVRITGLSDLRQAVLQVVQETLGHEWVFVQVHQVRCLHTFVKLG